MISLLRPSPSVEEGSQTISLYIQNFKKNGNNSGKTEIKSRLLTSKTDLRKECSACRNALNTLIGMFSSNPVEVIWTILWTYNAHIFLFAEI